MPTTTIRPVGDGDVIQWTRLSGSQNAEMVDEAVADDLSTYVYLPDGTALQKYDAYNHSGGVPADATSISLVTHGRFAVTNVGHVGQMQLGLRIGGVNYLGSLQLVGPGTTAWVDLQQAWATNPATEAAWTPAALNAAQLVIYCFAASDGGNLRPVRCTQTYGVATYTQPITVEPAGDLPAMSGALALEYKKTLTGDLPAMSAVVDNDAPIRIAGSLPAMSGRLGISGQNEATLNGILPAMSGRLALDADIALTGDLPAPEGEVHINIDFALAGNLPAMDGRIDDFTILTNDLSHSLALALFPRKRVRMLGGRQEVLKL